MDTERFDHLSTVLTASGTRRNALRSLAGLATALVVAGTLGGDEGEAKKKRKKGKRNKGGKGNNGGASNAGQSNGGNANDNGNQGVSDGNGSGNSNGNGNGSGNNGGSTSSQSEEEKLLNLINDFRAQNGQSALGRNGKLDTAALNHSRDMANRGYFSHNSPEGGTPDQRIVAAGYTFSWWGENIYKSAPGDATAQAAFTSWVNSSGHRANMLGSNFTQIGIGRATATDGRTYWTNTFGKPA